jgi:phosphoribosyl-AMP cyclohydrolase / phosphoribosyl-ATP pyrophosphohydrolase
MKRGPDFSKCEGLIPAIVQDARTGSVLMLGYMNERSYELTQEKGLVTFFSRSRNELWTKGETSGNYLKLVDLSVDCDQDAILVSAIPTGPTCHEGTESCFSEAPSRPLSMLTRLQETIKERRSSQGDASYTASLFESGIDKIAQKVGEEAIEVVIEGKNNDTDRLLNESADLLFHLMVLWEAKGVGLEDVCGVLERRASKKP